MNGKFVTLCLVGLFGSLFVGYCVYFDKKRRSDPDYKKKVVASELVAFVCTSPEMIVDFFHKSALVDHCE